MEKYQPSSLIRSALSLLVVLAVIGPAYAEQNFKKNLCKDNGGDWEDGECDFKTNGILVVFYIYIT